MSFDYIHALHATFSFSGLISVYLFYFLTYTAATREKAQSEGSPGGSSGINSKGARQGLDGGPTPRQLERWLPMEAYQQG